MPVLVFTDDETFAEGTDATGEWATGWETDLSPWCAHGWRDSGYGPADAYAMWRRLSLASPSSTVPRLVRRFAS